LGRYSEAKKYFRPMIKKITYILASLLLIVPLTVLSAQTALDLMGDDSVSDKLTKNIKIKQKRIEEEEKEAFLKSLWEEANNLYERGEYQQVKDIYARILIENPDDEIAAKMLSSSHNKIRQYDTMEIAALFVAGEKFLAKRENEKALDCFMNVLEIDPLNRKAESNISKIKEMLKSQEKAQLKSNEKESIDSLYTSGVKSYNKADYDKAIDFFEKVLMTDPTHESAYRYLEVTHERKAISEGEAKLNVKPEKKIEKCLDKIKEPLSQNKVEEKYQLAVDYFKKDLYKKSVALFLEVLDLKSGYKGAKELLNISRDRLKMMELLGDFEQASIDN